LFVSFHQKLMWSASSVVGWRPSRKTSYNTDIMN
jgi:hypothetical protein